MPIPEGTFTVTPGPTNDNTITEAPNNYEICDRTGFKVPRGTLMKEWDGRMVRPESFEMRHPQDFVRGVAEHQKDSSRPEPTDNFIADDDQVMVADLG